MKLHSFLPVCALSIHRKEYRGGASQIRHSVPYCRLVRSAGNTAAVFLQPLTTTLKRNTTKTPTLNIQCLSKYLLKKTLAMKVMNNFGTQDFLVIYFADLLQCACVFLSQFSFLFQATNSQSSKIFQVS